MDAEVGINFTGGEGLTVDLNTYVEGVSGGGDVKGGEEEGEG